MADPAVVAVPEGTWTKVATNVTSGYVWPLKVSPTEYMHTYRMTGGGAPTLVSEGAPVPDTGIRIEASAGIDVYLWALNEVGSVRMDL